MLLNGMFEQDDFFMLYTATTCGLRNDDAVNHCSVKDFRNTIRVE